MNEQPQNDHDLLIELRTEMRGLRDDFQKMNDGGQKIIADHEARIRIIEKYMWLAVGGLYIINTVLGIYLLIKKP